MGAYKLLVDTNVVIGLEDDRVVESAFAELMRLSAENGVTIFVADPNFDDVMRDKDAARRDRTLSKLAKFPKLKPISPNDEGGLARQFGKIRSQNDRSDVQLLAAVAAGAASFLVTQDAKLHKRAAQFGFGQLVLTVSETVLWLKRKFEEHPVQLPLLEDVKAYQIDQSSPFFDSLRDDYPEFDKWFEKCKEEHRGCWILSVEKEIAGIVIRKPERWQEAQTKNLGKKILKISTLKVSDQYHGEKLGELLVKQILWFALVNKYDLVYLTVFEEKHRYLVQLLEFFGFRATKLNQRSETYMEKLVGQADFSQLPSDVFQFARINYPQYWDGSGVKRFVVPIQSEFHRVLFPEIAQLKDDLPLFPADQFAALSRIQSKQSRTPGNAIRKVYVCRATTQAVRPGDLLYFYQSKKEAFSTSQSLTSLGVVQDVNLATSVGELERLTAKRSVYTQAELLDMQPSRERPVKVIDFLLVGHLDPAVSLSKLIEIGVFSGHPPQSITMLSDRQHLALKPVVNLGYSR